MAGMLGGNDETQTALEVRRARYLANLAALYRRDADLAAQIDALPFAAARPLEAARDGDATLKLVADDGREVYAHSRYKPREEAETFVANLPAADNSAFFISGLGAGHHVLALERRHQRPVLIVVEGDLGVIKSALCVQDLAGLIDDGRLILLTGNDRNVLRAKLNTCNADLMLGVQFVTLPHAQRCGVRFHEEMRRLLADYVAVAKLSIVTLLKNARITFKNVALNLPSYLAGPGVEALRGRAAGYPAIIVAAGPSRR